MDILAARQSIVDKLMDRLPVYVPEIVTCCENPACALCHGANRRAVWYVSYVRCRAMWVDAAKLHVHQGLVSSEIGDVQIQGQIRDRHLYEQAMNGEDAYILFDGRRIKPYSVVVNKLGKATSLDVRCNIVVSVLA